MLEHEDEVEMTANTFQPYPSPPPGHGPQRVSVC